MSEATQLEALHPDWQAVELPFAHYVHSFVSGDPKGESIRVRYFKSEEADVLWGRIWFGPKAEGPPGHAHGGAQAAALDEICGGAVWVHGNPVVAVHLKTEFVNFVPLKTVLTLHGKITKKDGRKIYTEGRIEDSEGRLLARGEVLFLQLSEEQMDKLEIEVNMHKSRKGSSQ